MQERYQWKEDELFFTLYATCKFSNLLTLEQWAFEYGLPFLKIHFEYSSYSCKQTRPKFTDITPQSKKGENKSWGKVWVRVPSDGGKKVPLSRGPGIAYLGPGSSVVLNGLWWNGWPILGAFNSNFLTNNDLFMISSLKV